MPPIAALSLEVFALPPQLRSLASLQFPKLAAVARLLPDIFLLVPLPLALLAIVAQFLPEPFVLLMLHVL